MSVRVIVIRRNHSRQSGDLAVCLRNAEGTLIDTYSRPHGQASPFKDRGLTDHQQHYYTRAARPEEVQAFVQLGLVEAPPSDGNCQSGHKRRGRKPLNQFLNLPAPLQAQRA